MQPKAIILRAPQRAAATVAALRPLGFESHCVQLIETIWPQDLSALDARLKRLLAGDYAWTVLTSVNTVRVLASRLGHRRIPASTLIAAVGEKTAESVAELLRREVDFIPEVQSAAGMLAGWQLPEDTAVFYPHGDLAAPTLADGLRRWRVRLDETLAYHTVPAGTRGTPVAEPGVPEGVRVLDAAQLPAALEDTDLLIFAAPSIVREFIRIAGTRLPTRVRTLAIGEPTARALRGAGLPADATALDPTPAGLAQRAAELIPT